MCLTPPGLFEDRSQGRSNVRRWGLGGGHLISFLKVDQSGTICSGLEGSSSSGKGTSSIFAALCHPPFNGSYIGCVMGCLAVILLYIITDIPATIAGHIHKLGVLRAS